LGSIRNGGDGNEQKERRPIKSNVRFIPDRRAGNDEKGIARRFPGGFFAVEEEKVTQSSRVPF
jgi:hypothetical protein